MQYFRDLLIGSHVTIYTDNRNISFQKRVNTSRINRWFLLLSDFSFGITHINGTCNETVDALSREVETIQHVTQIRESLFSKESLVYEFNISPQTL